MNIDVVGCASAAMMLKRFKRFSSQIFKWQNYNTGKITWIPFLLKYIWPSNSLCTLWGRFFLEIQSLQVLFYWMIIIKDYDCDLQDKKQAAFPNNLNPGGCILFKRRNHLLLYPLFLICCYKKVRNSCLFFFTSL